jgi:hypothetical protein
LLNSDNKNITNNINKAEGLEHIANQLLLKNSFMAVKSISKLDQNTGVINLNLLYYPIFEPFLRKEAQPTYLLRRSLMNKIISIRSRKGFRLLRAA